MTTMTNARANDILLSMGVPSPNPNDAAYQPINDPKGALFEGLTQEELAEASRLLDLLFKQSKNNIRRRSLAMLAMLKNNVKAGAGADESDELAIVEETPPLFFSIDSPEPAEPMSAARADEILNGWELPPSSF